MLLYDDTTLLSPSRNSSPDIILTVANLDIRQSDDGGDPMQPKAITIATILTFPTNNFLDDDTRNVEEGKGQRPGSNHIGRTPEVHYGMRSLMTETLIILVDLQFEFHLLLESWCLLEWESPRDYFREVEINNQAMEQLTRFQFYQDLHHRQYCLADRLPLP